MLPGRDPELSPYASLRYVTPGFFESVGTPVVQGRDVRSADVFASPFVAVVSQSFVRDHFPNDDPLGRSFSIGVSERTIVGVVGDIRVRGLERESDPQVYVPSTQVDDGAIIGKVDPQQPIADVQLLSTVVEAETAPRVIQLRVLGAFAATAFLLAGIGIHGLLAVLGVGPLEGDRRPARARCDLPRHRDNGGRSEQ